METLVYSILKALRLVPGMYYIPQHGSCYYMVLLLLRCSRTTNWVGLRSALHSLNLLFLVPYTFYCCFSSAFEMLLVFNYFLLKIERNLEAHLFFQQCLTEKSELILSDFPPRRKKPKPTRKRNRRRRKGGLRRTWHLRRMMRWQLWWASLALVPPRRVTEAFYAWPFVGLNFVGAYFWGSYLGKSLRWQWGGLEAGCLSFPSALRERAGGRGSAVTCSFRLSISLESGPLPIWVPNKEKPPPLRLLSQNFPCIFPLHLANLLWASYIHPVFCLCFNFDSCLACSRKVLWVPSFQLKPYPWAAIPPSFPHSPLVL